MTGPILIVDDNADLRETVQMLLEQSGYTVAAAANGQEALDALNGGARPSLILLDLMMPELNGWQFLESVRRDPLLASIPLVIMTAHKPTNAAPFPRGDVLQKPFDAAQLLATVARHAAG